MSLWDTLFQHLKVKIEEACCSSIFCQLKGANVVSKSAYLEAVKWPQTSGISKCVIQNYVVLEQWLRGAEATLRRYHMSKGKEKPQQNGRRGEAAFRIKPHTCQRHSEGSNISCAHQDPEIPQRLRQNCVWVSLERYRSAVDCFRSSGSGWSRPGYGISPLGRGHHWPYHRAARIYTVWGNRLLEGTNRNFCAPGPRRKEQWPHKRLTQTCPWVSGSLWLEVWLGGGLLQGWRHWVQQCVHETFWRRSPLSSLTPP